MHVCTYVLIPIMLHTYVSILFHMSCSSTLLGGNQTRGLEEKTLMKVMEDNPTITYDIVRT